MHFFSIRVEDIQCDASIGCMAFSVMNKGGEMHLCLFLVQAGSIDGSIPFIASVVSSQTLRKSPEPMYQRLLCPLLTAFMAIRFGVPGAFR